MWGQPRSAACPERSRRVREGRAPLYRGRKSNPPLPKTPPPNHLSLQLILPAKEQMFSQSNLPPRTHQTFPFIRLLLQLPSEQDFNPTAQKFPSRRIARAHRLRPQPSPPSIKPRREHTGIVEHDQIARPQQVRKLAKLPIFQSITGLRDRFHMQQPRSSTVRQRLLRNQFSRKFVMEIGHQHGSDYRHSLLLHEPRLRPIVRAFSPDLDCFSQSPAGTMRRSTLACPLVSPLKGHHAVGTQ